MKTPTLAALRFLVPSFAIAFSSPIAGHAQTLIENFDTYADGASFPPASTPPGSPTWTAWEAGAAGTINRQTSASAESAFTSVSNGLGFLLTDNTSSRSGGIETTFTSGFSTPFVLSFDYKLISGVGNDDITPQLRLRDTTSAATNPGIFLHLGTKVDDKYYIRNVAGTTTNLYEVSQDVWYRITLEINPATSRYDLTVLPNGGEPESFTGLVFRGASTNIDTLGFTNSGATSQTGSWALDNVSVSAVPEPSTYALVFGGFVLAAVVIRRPLRKVKP